MSGHDGSTEHGISSRLRFYTGHVADRHRIGRAGAGLRLGYLGLASPNISRIKKAKS